MKKSGRCTHHFPHGLISKSSSFLSSMDSNYRDNLAGSGLRTIDAPKALRQVIEASQKLVLRHIFSKDQGSFQYLGRV